MKTLSAVEVRRRFGSVLDMVAHKRIPVTIARANKPLVVMVPADEYRAGRSAREGRLRLTVEKLEEWKRLRARRLKGVNAVRLLREIRDER